MSEPTLDASVARLEEIKGDKQLYDANKIAEAEALAAEALRMANEAKLAAARLAEVKKTLSMFSNKLEKAEQSVQKDVEVVKSVSVEKEVEKTEEVVDEPAVEESPKEEVEAEKEVEAEEEPKADPPAPPTEVAKVEEVKPPAPVTPAKEPVAAPAEVAVYKRDLVEDFLDGIGVDKMCGVDDETLGFTDRVPTTPAAVAAASAKIFENPTKLEVKALSPEDLLHSTSSKQEAAAAERAKLGLPVKQYQRSVVNDEFEDPFGVDHDDLVLCGKIADLCEPPDFQDEDVIDAADDIRQ